jgi:aryl carrier-like protein
MFPLSMANEAFRNMAQARHIGKIILTVGDHHLPVAWQALPTSFAANASYLITGGFGGFGLLVAKWMAANGAQHLALMGRSGPASEEARRAVQALEKDGARVLIIRGDTSKEEDTAAALNRISAEMPPLRGVVHAAMVLEDRLLVDLDRERMEKVLDPKTKGAWNLHRLTLGLQLDFFIFFSSVSSLIGNPGQGNYVAANAFLDGLSFYRRSRGLPSLTINWGYLAEVGVAARNKDIRERFEHMGLKSFSPDEALDALGRLIRANPVETGVIHMDWSRWMEVYQSFERSPKYAHLLRREAEGPGQESSAAEGPGIHQAFIKAAAGDRAALLESALSEQVAKILGASVSKLDREKPLTEHGFDSLMAVELRNWVDGNLKITLPTMEIMRGPSIRQLTQRLIEIFTGSAVGTSPENSGKA